MTLTPRQKNVLHFITKFIKERGYAPTLREIGDACEISSSSVVDYNLRALVRKGHIRRDPVVSRGMVLVQ